MIYYSTGKSPYLKGRGKPITIGETSLSGNTAELLLKKGYVVKTIEELDDVKVKEPETVNAPLVEEKQEVQITIKKERKKRETKKTVKTRQKRSTNR